MVSAQAPALRTSRGRETVRAGRPRRARHPEGARPGALPGPGECASRASGSRSMGCIDCGRRPGGSGASCASSEGSWTRAGPSGSRPTSSGWPRGWVASATSTSCKLGSSPPRAASPTRSRRSSPRCKGDATRRAGPSGRCCRTIGLRGSRTTWPRPRPGPSRSRPNGRASPAGRPSCRAWPEPWKSLAKAVRRVDPSAPDEDFHRVRKLAKRALHAAEAVTDLLKPGAARDAERFVRRLARVKDVLGEHQDAVVACQAIEQIAAESPGRRPLPVRLGTAAGTPGTSLWRGPHPLLRSLGPARPQAHPLLDEGLRGSAGTSVADRLGSTSLPMVRLRGAIQIGPCPSPRPHEALHAKAPRAPIVPGIRGRQHGRRGGRGGHAGGIRQGRARARDHRAEADDGGHRRVCRGAHPAHARGEVPGRLGRACATAPRRRPGAGRLPGRGGLLARRQGQGRVAGDDRRGAGISHQEAPLRGAPRPLGPRPALRAREAGRQGPGRPQRQRPRRRRQGGRDTSRSAASTWPSGACSR